MKTSVIFKYTNIQIYKYTRSIKHCHSNHLVILKYTEDGTKRQFEQKNGLTCTIESPLVCLYVVLEILEPLLIDKQSEKDSSKCSLH